MVKRVSQLYGLDIYTERAEYVGKVEDIVLNLESGEIMRLSLKSFNANTLPTEEVRKIIAEQSIGYNDVTSVGDVILCKKNPRKEGRKAKKSGAAE
jgi:sporulation protein YlmC with PRC-barrel domain